VYQVTVTKDHGFKIHGTKLLLCAGGFIDIIEGKISFSKAFEKFSNGTDIERKIEAEKWYMEFYWAVPESMLADWIEKSPKKFQSDDTADKKVVDKCLEYVKQFVFVVEDEAKYLKMDKGSE
jgi:hypothetical protein